MKWYIEETSRLVKAWSGVASAKLSSDNTVALSDNGEYFINTCFGECVDPDTGEIFTIPNFADEIRAEIKDLGLDHLSFEEIARVYKEFIDHKLVGLEDELAEIEIVFVQNRSGILDEAYLPQKVEAPKPKVLEPV